MPRFRIANMTCGGCAKGVTATLRDVVADAPLRFDLEHQQVEVDTPAADATRLAQALRAAGWEAESLDR